MNEKKKGFIILAVIGVLLLLLIIIGVIQNKNKSVQRGDKPASSYSGNYSTDYNKAFESGRNVLVIGSSQCGYSAKFVPYMNYLSEVYNFKYYYLDATTVTSSELSNLLEKVGESIEDFGTPHTVFLNNGEKIGDISGYVAESALFNYLQANEIISSDEKYVASKLEDDENSTNNNSSNTDTSNNDSETYPNLTITEYEKFKEVYDSNQKSVIVLGQTSCGWCTRYKPVINEIAGEYQIPIYYININTYTSENYQNVVNSLSSYFKEHSSWGTPLTLIIENGSVVAAQSGYADKETTIEFYKANGIIQ